jgi:hypothetical protein
MFQPESSGFIGMRLVAGLAERSSASIDMAPRSDRRALISFRWILRRMTAQATHTPSVESSPR